MPAHRGTCHICGAEEQLTFEHVPPQSAFNNRPVTLARYEALINAEPGAALKGRIQQRGAGAYTLCGECNARTGQRYGGAFAEWSHQGMGILLYARRDPRLIYPIRCHPLRVIKQVVAMFFSVNSPTFQAKHPDLVRFVLNKDTVGVPPRYRLFTYFMATNELRHFGLAAKGDIPSGRVQVMTEVSFPPFGYLMTIDSTPPDTRLCEITFMVHHQYGDVRDLALPIRALPTPAYLPGDYRDLDQVRAAFRENTTAMASPRPEPPMTPERNAQMVANLLAMQSAFGRNK